MRYQAESLILSNYRSYASKYADGGAYLFSNSSWANAYGKFDGPPGHYKVTVGYFDENDGKTPVSVTVDGYGTDFVFDKNLGSGYVNSATKTERVTHQDVQLEKGDTFSLYARPNQWEGASFDWIEFTPITTPPPSEGGANDILFDLSLNGAGATTAGYDNLPLGVASSHAMAEMDVDTIATYDEKFVAAGDKFDLPPALLAAIASRESRGGSGLDANGWGDSGNAFGVMQVDKNWHTIQGQPDPYSQEHIDQASSILDWFVDEARAYNSNWSPAVQLQAGLAAYNGGPEVFGLGPSNFDAGTDGGDYSNDVWTRAQYYADHDGLIV